MKNWLDKYDVPKAQDGKNLSYGQWKKQFNLKETPDYNLKRAWELGYVPDKTGHLPTVDDQTGQFLKARGHSSIQKEIDWYNSPAAAEFRNKNIIDSSGKFFKYIPRPIPKAQNGIEGTMGGLTDKGFNYNGAWGGQFQDGGYIDSVLNANKHLDWVKRLYEKNTPSIQIPGQKGKSTHFMESGDGRVYPTVVRMPDGKLKYLGNKAYDYADSTKTYIQFPSDKEAQWFGENYKKGKGVLKNFQMGGSLPGAVGFTYARTSGAAPANGPYAKKTKASAENGTEMKFYQEGLDWKPRNISRDGINLADEAPIEKLDQLLNFTNYNKPTKGGWLDKY